MTPAPGVDADGAVYGESAGHYDILYRSLFDHGALAAHLRAVIGARRLGAGSLLEAACGTGLVLGHLAPHFEVAGFDLSPAMIAVARARLPGVPLHVADMTTWVTPERYDAVLCVGSSIGYAVTAAAMATTVGRLAGCLAPGGVLLVEPWFSPEAWEPGRLGIDTVDTPDLKLARLSVSGRDGTASVLDFHFLIGRDGAVDRLSERHVMGLFTDREMRDAFTAAGLDVELDQGYPTGRGLYVGQAPAR